MRTRFKVDSFQKRGPAVAGFTAGVVATLFLMAAGTVVATGHGLGDTPQRAAPVYPQL